jgi:hypothetical protein
VTGEDAVRALLDDEGKLVRRRVYDAHREDWMPSSWHLCKLKGVRLWTELAGVYGLQVQTQYPGRSRLACNDWVSAERLDKGVRTAALVDEYQTRHLAETGYPCIDPFSSIRVATNWERKRRAQRAAEAARAMIKTQAQPRAKCECGNKVTHRIHFYIGRRQATHMGVCAACYAEMKREDKGVW